MLNSTNYLTVLPSTTRLASLAASVKVDRTLLRHTHIWAHWHFVAKITPPSTTTKVWINFSHPTSCWWRWRWLWWSLPQLDWIVMRCNGAWYSTAVIVAVAFFYVLSNQRRTHEYQTNGIVASVTVAVTTSFTITTIIIITISSSGGLQTQTESDAVGASCLLSSARYVCKI